MAQSSVAQYGEVTAPTAGQTICQITAGNLVAGGLYRADVYYYLTGTPASPADDDNFEIQFNGTPLPAFTLPVPGVVGVVASKYSFVTTPYASGSLIVRSKSAGSPGAVYHVAIVAELIDSRGEEL